MKRILLLIALLALQGCESDYPTLWDTQGCGFLVERTNITAQERGTWKPYFQYDAKIRRMPEIDKPGCSLHTPLP